MRISNMNGIFTALIISILMLIAVSANAAITSDYNWKDSGNLLFYNSNGYESLFPVASVYFYDDFLGADLVIPASGSDESGCKWTKDIIGSATVAKGADAINGTVLCSLTAAAATEEAFLCMDDQRSFTLGQGLIFEARVQFSTLPSTATTETYVGLGIDTSSNTGEVGNRVCFMLAGSGLIYAELDDGTTETSTTTAVTATTTPWYILRIDAQSSTDIKFYINGARVAGGSTFTYQDSGTELTLQPWIGVYKDVGPGRAVITVDYVRIWQDRS